jgi:hypothetical protein
MPLRINEFFTLGNQTLFRFALLLSLLPIWLSTYPPMVDLPQHAGQIVALQEIWEGNPVFTDVFEINWFTPYLVGYLLVYMLSLIMPVITSIKLVITAVCVSIPLLTGMLLRETGADEDWKWLAIPSVFGYTFYWGFFNYLVTIPFGLLFLVLTVRFNRNCSLVSGLGIALYAVFLFFCHILALGFTSLLALTYLAGANYKHPWQLVLRFLPYTAPLPLIVLWISFTHSNETLASHGDVLFGNAIDRVVIILRQFSGAQLTTESFATFLPGLLASTLIAGFPLLAGARPSLRPERWLPFVTGTTVFLVFPYYVFGTYHLYQRFAVFLVPLWFMAWNSPEPHPARRQWLAISIIFLCAFVNIYRYAAFDRETQGLDRVLATMEPGKKVLQMTVDKRSKHFADIVYEHFGMWYEVKHRGITEFNFAYFFPEMVRYKKGKPSEYSAGFGNHPRDFDWVANNGQSYDYFIVRAESDMRAPLFKDRQDAVELEIVDGNWWLYRRAE